MNLFNMVGYELRKLFTRQKEIYIALFICTVLLIMMVQDPLSPSFWENLVQLIPWAGYFMIAAMIAVGTARVMPFEREQRMTELLVTYPKGRRNLMSAKQIVIFIYCLIITLYFHLVIFLHSLMTHEFTGAFIRIIELPAYNVPKNVPTPNKQLFLVEMFAYEILYITLASYVFALFVFCLSLFIQRSAIIIITAGSLFLFGELIYRFYFLFESQIGVYFFYIYHFGFNGMLSFRYLDGLWAVDPFFSMSGVLLFFILLSSLLFVLNLQIGRRKAYVAMGD